MIINPLQNIFRFLGQLLSKLDVPCTHTRTMTTEEIELTTLDRQRFLMDVQVDVVPLGIVVIIGDGHLSNVDVSKIRSYVSHLIVGKRSCNVTIRLLAWKQ